MNNESGIESDIQELMKRIVVSLRQKVVDEQAFKELQEILDKFALDIQNESLLNRKIAGFLFYIYTQLETQLSYSRDSQKEPIFRKKVVMLGYLRKIFGDIREN
ncbi:hypothetical protein ACFCP7_28335 [Paenibacillus elgii]